MPKVSVIVPIYNPPKEYITECLKSVMEQTFQDFEIIVVDDGSTQNTQEILSIYPNNKIRYFYKKNGGVNTARLIGLEQAKGEYIALIDQDDKWTSCKLKKQVDLLDKYPEINLVFSNFQNFNKNGPIGKSFFDTNKIIRGIPYVPVQDVDPNCRIFSKDILYDYLRGNFIIQCTLMIRTSTCRELNMFSTKTNGREQYEFGSRAIHLMRLGFIDEVMAHRRIHSNNVTHNTELFHKNTVTICTDAIEYPWMDKKCKSFLKNELINAYYLLGKYYFVKGMFIEARKALKLSLKKRISLFSLNLLFLTYILKPKIILEIKSLRDALNP